MSAASGGRAGPVAPGLDLIPARRLIERGFEAWFPLSPGDRALVSAGQEVAADTPLALRIRDPVIREVRQAGADDATGPAPGMPWPAGSGGAAPGDDHDDGEALFELDGRWRVVWGEAADSVVTPVAGRVTDVRSGSGIRLRSEAFAIRAAWGLGGPVRGRMQVATAAGGELRAPSIDVGRSGRILVAGSRIDAEALTRARAMGVVGIVVAALSSKERRDFLASEARQRAARQQLPAFGVLVVEGSIRRPIPAPIMAMFEVLDGQEVALLGDPPVLAFTRWPLGLAEPARDSVGIRSGPLVGREGRWIGPAGLRQFAGGVPQEAGWIDLDGGEVAVAVGDLERFV